MAFSADTLAIRDLNASTVLQVIWPPAPEPIAGSDAAVRSRPAYHTSFMPNCRLRGVPALVMRPKGPVPTTLPACPKRGVFVK